MRYRFVRNPWIAGTRVRSHFSDALSGATDDIVISLYGKPVKSPRFSIMLSNDCEEQRTSCARAVTIEDDIRAAPLLLKLQPYASAREHLFAG